MATTQTIDNTKKQTINLSLGGQVQFIPNFLSPKETQVLEKHLIKDITWVIEVSTLPFELARVFCEFSFYKVNFEVVRK